MRAGARRQIDVPVQCRILYADFTNVADKVDSTEYNGTHLGTAWRRPPSYHMGQMITMRRLALSLLIGCVALAACRPAPTDTPSPHPTTALLATAAPTAQPTALPSATPLATQDQIGVYAAVVRHLYGPSLLAVGGSLKKPVIYIIRATDDAAANPGLTGSVSVVLADPVRAGITAALADLVSDVVWVDQLAQVPLDNQTGAVIGGGALFRLGNIAPQPDGRLFVPGSIYVASLNGEGGTYIVEKRGGAWAVTGNTGPSWIS
jgi:hypothetical protein